MNVALLLALVIFAVNVAFERPVLDAFLFTLALVVGLTPQLLPAIVSVTLAQGARRMAREQVIVRRLVAIEDLGGMTVLCTDKTGTLTEGVVRLHGAFDASGGASERVRLLAYLNAAFESGFANPIDQALRAEPPAGAEGWEKLDEVPYDFVRRRLSVAVRRGDERLLITKGAVAEVLRVCTRAERPDGASVPLADVLPDVEARFEALSREGLRCLAVAVRDLAGDAPLRKEDEREMVLAGILGLFDPPKEGALEGLRELKGLGISLKLVTGDNRHVAARVAGDAGLDPGALLTGAELRPLSGAALARAVARAEVFAEVEPSQKEANHPGAEEGRGGGGVPGRRDQRRRGAPRRRRGDLGGLGDGRHARGRRRRPAAEGSAGAGQGVREGRRAFANTLKYIFITTSASFGNMFSMAGASLFAGFLPLLPKQVLLINALTDLPAMAIATDRLDPELTQRPRRWSMRYIRAFMLTFGLTSSAFDFLTFGTLLALGVSTVQFRTGWFLESVLSELLILLVIRTRRFFLKSPVGRGLLAALAGGGAASRSCSPSSRWRAPSASGPCRAPPGDGGGDPDGLLLASEAGKRIFFRQGRGMRDEARSVARERPGAGAPDERPVPRLRFRWGRSLALLLLFGAAVHVLLPQLATMQESLRVLERMRWWLVALAVGAQAMSYGGSGYLLHVLAGLTGERLAVRDGVAITLAASSVALVTGGRSASLPPATAGPALGGSAAGGAAGGLAPHPLQQRHPRGAGGAGLAELLLHHRLSRPQLLAFALVAGRPRGRGASPSWRAPPPSRLDPGPGAGGAGARTVAAPRPDEIRAREGARRLFTAWDSLRDRGWGRPTLGAALNTGFDLLTLGLLFAAAGHPVGPGVLLAGYGLPLLLGKLSLLPGGVGVTEAGMTAMYGGLGVAPTATVLVVLAYRALSFWLPTLVGFPLILRLQRPGHASPDESGDARRGRG